MSQYEDGLVIDSLQFQVRELKKQLQDYENIIAALQQENEELTETVIKQRDTVMELRGDKPKAKKRPIPRPGGASIVEPTNLLTREDLASIAEDAPEEVSPATRGTHRGEFIDVGTFYAPPPVRGNF